MLLKKIALAMTSLLLIGFLSPSISHADCIETSGPTGYVANLTNLQRVVGVIPINVAIGSPTLTGTDSSDYCSSPSVSYTISINGYSLNSNSFNTTTVPDGGYKLTVTTSDSLGGSSVSTIIIIVSNNLINPAVFDVNYYLQNNSDVAAATGGDPSKAITHWLTYGINEGRMATLTFSIREYVAMYGGAVNADSINAFITSGLAAGQAGRYALRSEVFTVAAYLKFNTDLRRVFRNQPDQATQHWLTHGINEGRRAAPSFWSKVYLKKNSDIARVYGKNNFAAAIEHYIISGLSEGRPGI